MEKRNFQRKKALLNATALFNDGQFSLPCTIRDISDGGMKLNISDTIILPDTFELHIPSQHMMHRVRLKWRRADDVGVALSEGSKNAVSLRHDVTRANQTAVLEEEIMRLNSLLAKMSEERDALRKLFREAVKRLQAAGLDRGTATGSADVGLDEAAFDVFDDATRDWRKPEPAARARG